MPCEGLHLDAYTDFLSGAHNYAAGVTQQLAWNNHQSIADYKTTCPILNILNVLPTCRPMRMRTETRVRHV